MLPISEERLLAIWENPEASDADVGTRLLRAGSSANQDEDPDDWPLSKRQAALLEMRCATFGPTMQAAIDCPECSKRLEFELDGRALLDMHNGAGSAAGSSRSELEIRGLKFRLPTPRDLAAVRPLEDEHTAVLELVGRCCLESPAPETWSRELLDEIDERFEAADPLGNLELTLECPDCRHAWQQAFDVARYFADEIDARARVILVQVHCLARAYGWSEKDVFALSAARRRVYLEMITR
jgi:hypothetical protein